MECGDSSPLVDFCAGVSYRNCGGYCRADKGRRTISVSGKAQLMVSITITDELSREIAVAAQVQGQTPEEFVIEALTRAVWPGEFVLSTRNGLPVMVAPPGTPPMDPATIREAIEEDGF